MHMTTAEQRAKKMDVKHAMLAQRAKNAKDRCEALAKEYVPWCDFVGFGDGTGGKALQYVSPCSSFGFSEYPTMPRFVSILPFGVSQQDELDKEVKKQERQRTLQAETPRCD